MAGIKVAVIGTNIGSTLHIRALQAAGFDVAMLCGRDPERTAERASHFGIPTASTSIDEVVGGDVDALVVATPPTLHHPIAMAAIAAGKHVLCEKPLAATAALAAEMRDAAASANVVCALQHQLRWQPSKAMLRRVVEQGVLGTLIQGAFEFEVPMMHRREVDVPDWWLAPESGGGWLRNWNTHGIDLVRYMLGEFEAVSGRLHADPGRNMTSDDSYVMNFVLANGMQGSMTGSCRTRLPHVESRVIGADATAALQFNRQSGSEDLFLADDDGFGPVPVPEDVLRQLHADGPAETEPKLGLPDMGEGVYQEIHATNQSFVEQVRLCTGFRRRIEDRSYTNPAIADFSDGVAAMKVVEAVERAAREQRWVSIDN